MARRKPPPSPVRRSGAQYEIDLGEEGRELVVRLLGQLRDLLVTGAESPALRRVFPPAYHLADDAEADAEYRRLMHDELVASRLAALQAVVDVLQQPGPVDEAGLMAFMQSLNTMRLVLGTVLDVQEDDPEDVADIDPDDEMAAERHLYGYLSYLLGEAVIAISR